MFVYVIMFFGVVCVKLNGIGFEGCVFVFVVGCVMSVFVVCLCVRILRCFLCVFVVGLCLCVYV